MSADLTEMVAFLREHIERDAQTAFDRDPEVGIMFSDHVDSIGSICDEAVRAEGDERKLWAHAVSILVSAYHNHNGFNMDWAPGNSEYHLVRLAKIREGEPTSTSSTPRRSGGAARPGTTGLFTLAHAGDVLGVSEKTVRRYIRLGLLPGHRLGPRVLRVMESDLDALLTPLAAGDE